MTEKKLIPFDLERALAGDSVIRRDGTKIIEVMCYKTETTYPLNALDEDLDSETYTNKGSFIDGNDDHEYDLFMAPKTKKYYFNIYRHKKTDLLSSNICGFLSEQEAKESSDSVDAYDISLLKTVAIEIEE